MTGWGECCCFTQLVLEGPAEEVTSKKRSDIYVRLGCSRPCDNVITTLSALNLFSLYRWLPAARQGLFEKKDDNYSSLGLRF